MPRACPQVCLLNDLFSVFDDLVMEHGVFKVETIGKGQGRRDQGRRHSKHSTSRDGIQTKQTEISLSAGDAYMVVSGHEPEGRVVDHASRMLRMAKGMLAAVEALGEQWAFAGEPLQVRIGVHTGPAHSGVVGSLRPRYCFFGGAVLVRELGFADRWRGGEGGFQPQRAQHVPPLPTLPTRTTMPAGPCARRHGQHGVAHGDQLVSGLRARIGRDFQGCDGHAAPPRQRPGGGSGR